VLLRGTAGKFDIALVPQQQGIKPGPHVLAFKLQAEIDLAKIEKQLRDANVDVKKVVDRPEKQGLVVADPDGLLLEFYRRKGSAERFSDLDVVPYLSN
jgi:catechol-2,3-dioxygenase